MVIPETLLDQQACYSLNISGFLDEMYEDPLGAFPDMRITISQVD